MVWKRVKFTFVPCAIVLSFFIYLFSANICYAGGDNLIRNAGFEHFSGKMPRDWQLESWTQGFSSGFASETVHGGKCDVFIQSVKENDIRFIQTIAVKPDTVYRFSGWMATRDVPSGTIGANLCIMGTFVHSPGINGTHPWTNQTLLFRTSPRQHYVTIAVRLGFYSDTTTGTAYFDDLKLERATRIGNDEKIQALTDPSSDPPPAENSQNTIFWPAVIMLFYLLLLCGIRFGVKPLRARFSEKLLGITPDFMPKALIFLSCWALIFRWPLLMQAPFPSDLVCFENWALRMAQTGPVNFFQSGYFCDYPPFGLLILWPVGWIAKVFSLHTGDLWFNLWVKTPGILCDMATVWLLYALFRKKSPLWGQIIAAIYLFLPAVLYNSTYWGQIDSYYTLIMLVVFYVLVKKDSPETAAILVIMSVLTKTQTIAFIPLMLFVLVIKYPWQRVVRTLLAALACFVLIVLPFGIGKPVTWIFSHYSQQAGLYPFASLNAANFMALLGGNEVADTMPAIFGIPFNVLGIALFLGVVVWTCRYYYIKRTSGSLAVGLAMAAFSFFLFFPRIHERYLFPALAFFLVTLGYYRERKVYFGTIVLSISYLFNLHGVVLKYAKLMDEASFTRLIYILAIVNTAVFIGIMTVFQAKISRIKSQIKQFWKKYSRAIGENLRRHEISRPFRMQGRDYRLMGGLVLAYAALLFFNLGSWQTPQTGMDLKKPADGLEIRFDHRVSVSAIGIYDAEGTGGLGVEYLQNNGWQEATVVSCNDYYVLKWEPLNLPGIDRLRLIPRPASGRINEIVFFDAAQKLIPVKDVISLSNDRTEPARRHPLFDEQSRAAVQPSFLNSTYFDEIYHGRTAYEFVTGSPVYETTHPPLGKDLLALGILIFGMNPLGMRIMHALAGLLLMIVLFVLGREVLKTRFGAYALMLFGMLDFMPFVQSRYATIDSTSVLLMTLMFYFTFRFIRFETEGATLKRNLINLFGIIFFFALAAATKWTAIYGFGGVIVLIGLTTIHHYRVLNSKSLLDSDPLTREMIVSAKKSAKSRLVKFLALFLVIFLVVAPLVYFLTYLPFLHAEGVQKPFSWEGIQTVIKSQVDMYQYHSQLKATHPFSSSWWSWPFDFKPLWLYMDRYPPNGLKGSIVSFGNPLIWLLGTLGVVLLLYRVVTGLNSRHLFLIFICFFAVYLPWVLISRVTFIYHFYPALPWFLICAVLILEPFWEMDRGIYRKVVMGVFCGSLLLFILFYPVLTGIDVSTVYIDTYLRWFPRDWMF